LCFTNLKYVYFPCRYVNNWLDEYVCRIAAIMSIIG